MTQPEQDPTALIRVGDLEREATIERLSVAHSVGQLDLNEFDERSAAAISAKTARDLAVLTADLPVASTRPAAATAVPARRSPPDPVKSEKSRPRFLAQTWVILVTINIVIWGISSIATGETQYFWPMWVAVGFGIPALFDLMNRRS